MNPFLDACQATGPLMLTVESPGLPAGDAHAFEQPFVLLGRDPRCDLRLNHPEVSDRHAYLQLVAGRLVCVDLGSRDGVYQGGRRGRLIDVDRDRPIRIGPYRIRLLGGDHDGPPARPAFHGGNGTSPDASTDVLELSHRGLRQSRSDLPPGLALVGSSADCTIRLVDPSVSHYHASLVRTGEGVWIVDLLGQEGVRVNGHAVSFARLEPGDSVELGHSVIRLSRVPHASSRMPAAPAPPRHPAPDAAAADPAPEPELQAVASLALTHEPAAVGHEAVEALCPVAPATEIVEQVLAPVVNQVGLLQQRMIEEFHQARESMFEMFATLHQEQSAFLNHELEQLRQLGHNLHTLQADLERQTRALSERLDPGSVSAMATTVTTVTPATNGAGVAARSGSPATDLPPLFVSRPTTVPTGPVGFNGIAGRDHRHDFPTLREPVVALDAADPALDRITQIDRGTMSADSDENLHTQLSDRIALIQEEHQSRWQKLLSIFQSPPQGRPIT